MQLLALASLDAITKGHGTAEHIGAISLACNMTGALIRQGIGEEATEIVGALPDGADPMRIGASQKVGRWGFSGPELQHVRDLLTCTSAWCRTPHNSKSAARFGILTTASRVAKFCRGSQREPRIWIGWDAGEPMSK